jgi:hypothetical protein
MLAQGLERTQETTRRAIPNVQHASRGIPRRPPPGGRSRLIAWSRGGGGASPVSPSHSLRTPCSSPEAMRGRASGPRAYVARQVMKCSWPSSVWTSPPLLLSQISTALV